jgi:4-hydroxythreonine-4-phosphate dehydrogenase
VIEAAAKTLSLPIEFVVVDDGLLTNPLPLGRISQEAGAAAVRWVRNAAAAVLAGTAEALVTAPIHKEAAALGGSPFPGHTELLANIAGSNDVSMMLVAGNLRVVHVSTHVSLRQAIDAVTELRVVKTIESAIEGCRLLGLEQPRIAVAGLNPHAGEGGKFGTEEQAVIAPAIASCAGRGCNIVGPVSPDTVFARALQCEFDIVVAMYHDQGHIPVKLAGFDSGVNVTVGLPFIRTSPDHGTAFDIAGKGIARADSMVAALLMAAEMVTRGR